MSWRGPRLAQAALMALVAGVSACAPTPTAVPPAAAHSELPLTSATAPSATNGFALTSSAFSEGGNIPAKFTCTGAGTSPEIQWSGAPTSTMSFAFILDDPDAPAGTFTHWVAFDLPATQSEIPEGAVAVGKGGKNGRGQTGYTAPCPPSGTHRYFFTLYALDLTTLGLSDGAPRSDVEKAMDGHILAKTQLMGRYSK
jgi:Raf kinase inhibitor-like YbhB/YbcL family protein